MLNPASFSAYPPQAAQLARTNLSLLNQLPTLFAAILLREIISFDWKFPAERTALQAQLKTLASLDSPALDIRMAGFTKIRLTPQLKAIDWPANPAAWMEQLTATLWSSGQMDAFRAAADAYAAFLAQANPAPRPAQRRLGLVILGRDAAPTPVTFRKLRPHGTLFTRVDPTNGLDTLLAAASKRTSKPSPYAHWYIDGGTPTPTPLTQISYASLQIPRTQLLAKTEHVIGSGTSGPEALRSFLARLTPEEIGLATQDPVLDRFQLSLLTEGSGTQIFATTFVQWAARECLRRAQPETLVLRFTPRQQMQPMNTMLSGAKTAALDPAGSLIDAGMAAFYTWINMNRLSGADRMSFLVWHEGHAQALAIAPTLPGGSLSDTPLTMQKLLRLCDIDA